MGVVICVTVWSSGVRALPPELTERSDLVVSKTIGACLAREDPDCAAPWIAELKRRAGRSFTHRYAEGHSAFLRGEFALAAEALGQVAGSPLGPKPLRPQAEKLAAAAAASARATRGFLRRPVAAGRFVIWVQPGPDEVLIPLLDRVLTRAAAALSRAVGPLPVSPVAVHVYPKVEMLAAVSGLTPEQVRTSGTIALCKHNRLMITSPRDLFFGYHWADTVAHELVHYLIMKHGGADVPVWLHEALARTLESTWRADAPPHLDPDEITLLQKARRKRRFITFRQMHPTMAALPSQEAAQTAFAEVHHAMIWLLGRARRSAPDAQYSQLIARMGQGAGAMAAVQVWAQEPKFPTPWWAALRRGELLRVAPIKIPGAHVHANQAKRQMTTHHRGVRGRLRFRGSSRQGRAKLTRNAARYVELGDRLLAINRPLAAVLEYRKAQTAGAKDDAMMLTRLARGLVQLRRFTEAKVVLDDAVIRFRHHAPLLVLLAKAAHALKDQDAALHWAEQALWINPFDPAVHQIRADVFTTKGETEAATQARLAKEQVSR